MAPRNASADRRRTSVWPPKGEYCRSSSRARHRALPDRRARRLLRPLIGVRVGQVAEPVAEARRPPADRLEPLERLEQAPRAQARSPSLAAAAAGVVFPARACARSAARTSIRPAACSAAAPRRRTPRAARAVRRPAAPRTRRSVRPHLVGLRGDDRLDDLARRIEHLDDLVGADAIAERLDHGVAAADEEEVAVLVAPHEIAGEHDPLGVRRARRTQRVRAGRRARSPPGRSSSRAPPSARDARARRPRPARTALRSSSSTRISAPGIAWPIESGLRVDHARGGGRCCGTPR